jgi:hypothetical protein
MRNRSHLKRKKRSKTNFAALTKKKLVKFIKNLTRRTSRTFKKFRKQKGG